MPKRPPVYVHPSKLLRQSGKVRRPRSEERAANGDASRPSSHARGYDGTWRKLRLIHLADNPWCVRCWLEGRVTRADDVDHIEPIVVNPARRLDPTNLQSLCERHHRKDKQREDRARYGSQVDDGRPGGRRWVEGESVNQSDESRIGTDSEPD